MSVKSGEDQNSEWILKEVREAKKQNRDVVPVLMERLDNVEEALHHLEVSDYQLIDYVTQRKSTADKMLSEAIESTYKKWIRVTPYLQLLASNDPSDLMEGIQQIGKLRGNTAQAVKLLMPYLSHANYEVRAETVQSLSHIGDRSIVEPLIDFIEDTRNHERESGYYYLPIEGAIEAIGHVGDQVAIEYLKRKILASHATDREYLFQLVMALGLTRDRGNVEFVCEIFEQDLKSLFPHELWKFLPFLYALGMYDDKKCVPTLINFIARIISIMKLGFNAREIEEFGEFKKNSSFEPGFDPYAIFDDLRLDEEYIEDWRFHVVTVGILVLGSFQDLKSTDVLLELLELRSDEAFHNDGLSYYPSQFFFAAIEMLGESGDKKALPKLRELQKDEYLDVDYSSYDLPAAIERAIKDIEDNV